ncbi:unnamed protein product [Absidia cylindrospora]
MSTSSSETNEALSLIQDILGEVRENRYLINEILNCVQGLETSVGTLLNQGETTVASPPYNLPIIEHPKTPMAKIEHCTRVG